MFNLLNKLYTQFEQIKGRKLIYLLIAIFVVFLITGLGLGYITNALLNNSEDVEIVNTSEVVIPDTYLVGRVSYVNSGLYPEDNISYVLVDDSGKELMLLKSKDQKLVVTEGHKVKVKGKLQKTKDGQKEVLLVEEIIIQNDAGASF